MKTTNRIVFALLRLLHTGSDKISIRLQSVTNIGINKYVKNDTMHKSQIFKRKQKNIFEILLPLQRQYRGHEKTVKNKRA